MLDSTRCLSYLTIGNSGEVEAASALGDDRGGGRPDAGSIAKPLVVEHVGWARDRLARRR